MVDILILPTGLLIPQILMWLTELAPKWNFHKWQDGEIDIGLHVHNVPHHTRLCVTSTHPGRLQMEAKAPPEDMLKEGGKDGSDLKSRPMALNMPPQLQRLAFPNPCVAPISAEITCFSQNLEDT